MKKDVTIKTTFYVNDFEYANKARVAVHPTVNHYEQKGEPLNLKCVCPICNDINHLQVYPIKDDYCPTCGINFDWSHLTEKEALTLTGFEGLKREE